MAAGNQCLLWIPAGPAKGLVFLGSVDSNWIMGATLENKLPPLPLTLSRYSFLKQHKSKLQYSFGLTTG